MDDDLDLRASDGDRERVAAALREFWTEGRLSVAELEERLEEAYAARTLRDLQHPLRELPALPAVPVPTTPVSLRDRYRNRDKRASPQAGDRHGIGHGFSQHLTSYVLVNLMLVGIWALSGGGYFWPAWAMFGWGIGVVSHGLAATQGRNRARGQRGGA